MPLYRLAYKYYIDDNFSKKKFAEFFRRYLKDSPDIVSTLLDLSEGRLKRRELIELCIESNNNCIRKYGESYSLADYVKNLNDPIKILMCYRENSDNSIIVKEVAKNIDIKKFAETTIELPGFAVTMSSIEEAIKKDIKDKGIEGKEISVYVNVEQKAAYYTVDGQGSDDYRIDLNTL